MSYNPRQIPEVGSVEELRQWLNEELKILSQSLNESTELELRGSRREPDRPREGMIIHADGTSWNPGSGQGTYRYQSGTWVKIPIAGTDVVTGQASSVDGEIALFSGTGGKALKRATGSGLVRATSGVYSTDVAANADLADMAAWTIKMRNNGSSGVPQDQTVNDLTEETTGDAAADFALMWDASGAVMRKMKPNNFGIATGGLTLISSAGVGTGTTYSVTGLGGYKAFMIEVREVSHNSGASQAFRVAVSGDNGGSYGTAQVQGIVFAAATLVSGYIFMGRADQTNQHMVFAGSLTGGVTIDNSSRGPINALQFSFAAGNFDNGSIDIYGIK